VSGGGDLPGAVVIRPARLDELDALVDLLAAVASEGRWIATELPFDRAERRERYRATLEDPAAALLVAVAGQDQDDAAEIVGDLGVHLATYGVAELGMAVVPGWRGRGVGSALLSAAVDWAREAGAHKLALQVWPHNRAALALYKKFGFEREGYLRGHYRRRSGELWDAIVMGKRLA